MSYIGRPQVTGPYIKLDDISSQFNGSTTTFNLTSGGKPFYASNPYTLLLSLGGGGNGGGSPTAGQTNSGGGGGGSGYVNPSFVSGPFTNAQGSGRTSGGSTDPQWPGSVGTGGLANNGAGQSGFARITYNGVETTYSYTGSNVTITL